MQTIDFSALQPKVVLGVAAHPDDLDFTAAGTLAAFAAAGAAVHYLIITDGGKGTADPTVSSHQLTQMRRAEQQTGLQAIGGQTIAFLDYPDGSLEVTQALKKDIVQAIRTIRPDVVVTMDPSVLYSAKMGMINHPDHRAAGQATLDAVYPLARDHLSFPELAEAGLAPHKTATILLSNSEDANFYVDITETIDAKAAALQAHASQIADMDSVIDYVRRRAADTGEAAGYAFAESFVRIDIHA